MRDSTGRDFDVLIVGAGIIGATIATLLIARQCVAAGRVAVIADRQASDSSGVDSQWDLRVFALSRASQRVLELCGTWALMPPAKMGAYERMCVWDERGEAGGSGSMTFDCAELGEPNLGFIVEARALQDACLRAATAAGVVFLQASVDELTMNATSVSVRLSDGRGLNAQLLIAADGTDSKTRALLGIQTAGHTYRQDALVAHVRTSKSHDATAWQRFLSTGPLALLPLPDGRCSIVWSTRRDEASRLRALDPLAFGAAVTQASGAVLGECQLTTPIASFPLKLQYAVDYVRGRAVLVGDAAHVVHPLAGQGLNLGLLDCASLADVLGEASRATDLGDQRLLRRYERRRRSENLQTAAALDGLERLFASASPMASTLRRLGLGMVARLPFIKRELAERAMGIRGDVPDFLFPP